MPEQTVAKGLFSLLVDKDAVQKDISGLPDKLSGAFGKLGKAIGGDLGGKIGGALDGVMGKIASGTGAGGLLNPLTLGVAAGAAVIGTALFKVGSDFDKTYKQIQKQTGATGEDLKALEGSFRNVAKQTGASFENIGAAVAGVSQRTGATGQSLEALSLSMLRMSSITGKDLNTVIDKSTSLFNQWGIPVDKMPGALDRLYVASAKTGIGVDELASNAQKMGPALRTFGFGFEEAIGLLASFDKAGIDSGRVSAALNTALGKLSKSGATDLPAALNESIKAIQGAGSAAEANEKAIALFGARAGPQMAEAIRSGAFSVDELVDSLKGADGALQNTASETATFGGKMEKLKNQVKVAFEPAAMGLFDAITGALMTVLPYVAKFVEALGTVISWVAKCKPLLIALGVVIGGFAAALVAVTVATKLYHLAMAAWNAVMLVAKGIVLVFKVAMLALNVVMALNPFVLVAIAIVALVAAFVLLWTKCEGFRNFMTGMWEALKSGVMAVKDAFVSAFNWIMEAIAKVWDWIQGNWPLLLGILTGPIGLAVAAIIKYWDQIQDVIAKVVGWFKELPGKVIDAISGLAGRIATWAGNLWTTGLAALKSAWTAVGNWFGTVPNMVITAIGDLGRLLVKWAESAWAAALAAVKTAANAIVNWLKDNWKELLVRALLFAFTGPGGVVAQIVLSFDPIKNFITKTLPGWFADLPKKLMGAVSGLGEKLAGLGSFLIPDLSGLEEMPKTVGRLITDVVNTIKKLPSQMVSALSGLGTTVSNTVKNALSSVTNVLGGLGGSISGALKGLPQQITGALGGLSGVLEQMGSKMMGSLSNGMRDASKWVTDVAKSLPGAVQGALGNVGQWLWGAGQKVIGGLTNGIRAAISWIGDAVGQAKSKAQSVVSGAVNWLYGAGQQVIGGLTNGIRGAFGWIAGAMGQAKGFAQGAVGGAVNWLYSSGRAVIQGLINGIRGFMGGITGAAKGAFGAAKAAMVGAFNWLYSSGRAIIQGLINGIHSMVSAVKNAINSVLNAARRLLPFSPAKEGPFSGRGAPIYSGISIASQLAEGIVKATPLVAAAALGLAEAAHGGVGADVIDLSAVGRGMAGVELADAGGAGPNYTLEMHVAEADTSQMQAGFRRLELLSGAA